MISDVYKRVEYSITVENTLISFFIETNNQDYQQNSMVKTSLHLHSHTEIFACKSGQVSIKTKNEIITLNPKDIAFVPSGIMHIKNPENDTKTGYLAIGITCTELENSDVRDLYSTLIPLLNNSNVIVLKNRPRFCEIIENICNSKNDKIAPHLLMEFVAELFKISSITCPEDYNRREQNKQKIKNIDRLLNIEYFLNNEFSRHLTNRQIANELHICERQLSRLVVENYGTTLRNLIMNKRIECATNLLVETDNTVESIAFAVGFNSKKSFYREFKKKYFLTPTQYRKTLR